MIGKVSVIFLSVLAVILFSVVNTVFAAELAVHSAGTDLWLNSTSLTTMAGDSNTVFGINAGDFINNPASHDNTLIGRKAGFASGYGIAWQVVINNTYIGSEAGNGNNSGSNNTFVGWHAGYSTDVTGAGTGTGSYNTFFGVEAGRSNTTGNANTFIGVGAGDMNTVGSANTYLGEYAGGFSNGSKNVFIGDQAGLNEDGSNMLYIDNCFTQYPCSKPLIKGDFSARTLQVDGSLTIVSVATPSDIRYKREIHALESSLDKVLRLQGVTYEWDQSKVSGVGYKGGKQIGFVAQEVEKILPELVQTDSKGYKTLSYDKVVPVLVEAMKEQQSQHIREMKEKDSEIESLKKALLEIANRLAVLESSGKTVASK